MGDLNGKNFRALRRLSDKDGNTLADVGETCERVPVVSLPSLLANGSKIAPVTETPVAVTERPVAAEPKLRRRKGEA